MSNQGFQSAMEALNDAYEREAKLQIQLDIAVGALQKITKTDPRDDKYMANAVLKPISQALAEEALAKIKGEDNGKD